jgi:high-affinity iron transporter
LVIVLGLGALAFAAGCSSEASDAPSGSARVEKKPAATVTPEMLERGRGIYKTYCAACHGESGRGDGPAAGVMEPPPRDHTDRAYMSALSDEDLAKTIQIGGAIRNKPLMPGNPQIKGADLEALVKYVRSLSEPKPAASH